MQTCNSRRPAETEYLMNTLSSIIYLDNNATTPVDPRVLAAMMPYFTTSFANASSTHQFGADAYQAVKDARAQVAELIGADTNEIIFTSGATESINLALKGVAEQYQSKGTHIVTVATEHSAVLDTCQFLATKGFDITYLPVEPNGLINVEQFEQALRPDTILACVMYVNNETGVIQPIQTLADVAHKAGALFMTDGTQAVGKIPIVVDALGIDLMPMSAHKMYGPKGIGALYVRQRHHRIKFPALLHGGGHERGMRSGTLNVPGIIGLGEACAIATKEMEHDRTTIGMLRDYAESELLTIPHTTINGATDKRLYNVTNLCFHGADSDAIIMGLSSPDSSTPLIAVSNGSACTAATIEPSHVLIAMGLDDTAAFNSIRFSLGKFTTKDEMVIVVDAVKRVVGALREMVG